MSLNTSDSSTAGTPPFGSNALRLTAKQWLVVAVAVVLAVFFLPGLWIYMEKFEPPASYRVPYELSEDYWHYERYCRVAMAEGRVAVLGDSVIWGEYVDEQGTLSHHLNARVVGAPFANLGVNGIHPAALAGLVEYYARSLRNRPVLLHYNPLWMSSKRHDLQTEKEFRFNHPALVPQFFPSIPCYKDPWSDRLGVVAGRHLPIRGWLNHLTKAYFEGSSPAAWAMEHPYESPLGAITLALPKPDERRRPEAPWHERGIRVQPFEWVPADESLQWRFFQDTVETLEARGNRLYVIVGPFNEHMIAPESRQAYDDIKESIAGWLCEEGIPYLMADLLPSDRYADASHPFSAGYETLARQVYAAPEFTEFLRTDSGIRLAGR